MQALFNPQKYPRRHAWRHAMAPWAPGHRNISTSSKPVEVSQEEEKQIMTSKVTSLLLRSSGPVRPQFWATRYYSQRVSSKTASCCSHFSGVSGVGAPNKLVVVTPTQSPLAQVVSISPFPQCGVNVRREFHSSSSLLNAQRRRRRGGASSAAPVGGEDGDEPHVTRPIPVKDTAKFLAASRKELDRIEDAIEPMKSCNDMFDVTRSTNDEGEKLTIRLQGGDGTYTVQIDERNFTMNLTSPMSGAYTYVLCSMSGDWLGMDDAHSFQGMMTRDLIRQCNGVPRF